MAKPTTVIQPFSFDDEIDVSTNLFIQPSIRSYPRKGVAGGYVLFFNHVHFHFAVLQNKEESTNA